MNRMFGKYYKPQKNVSVDETLIGTRGSHTYVHVYATFTNELALSIILLLLKIR